MATARIMVVEDERIISMSVQQTLKGMGFGIAAVATSGKEAIQKAEETQPDLILMDIGLKGDLDGIETAGQINARFDVPIIYLTADDYEQTLQRAKNTEPYGYILKPFQKRELYTTIEMALHRHRLERKLRERERWLGTILRSIGDAVIATDARGWVTYLNPVAEKLTGWGPGEAIGKSLDEIFSLIDEETRKGVENPVARVIREGSPTGIENHAILVTRNRTEIPIDDSAAPIKDKKGNLMGVVMIFRDITDRRRAEKALLDSRNDLERRVHERTVELVAANHKLQMEIDERKRAEETLRESEDRYRDLVEYSQYLILTHNLEGQILSVNQGGVGHLGFDQKDFFNKNIRDLLPPEVKDGFDAYLDTVRRHGTAKGLMLVQTSTGERRVWEYNNTLRTEGVTTPIVRSMAHDVTDRVRSEKAVKRLSQENAIMAEIGRIISSTLNVQEVYERFAAEVGKLISFDRIAMSTVNPDGRSAMIAYVWGPEIPDRKQGDVLPAAGSLYERIIANRSGILTQMDDEDKLAESYPSLLNLFRAGFRSMISVPLISKDQLIGLLNLQSFEPKSYTEPDLRLAEKVSNQIAGAIANAQLFMERVRAEEERAALQEQLRQSQKMEAVGQLAGGVAHDFNNLLTVIHGYSELILSEIDGKDRFFQDVHEIKAASERAASLTRQLLAFSRKQVLQPKVLDLNSLVLNIEKMLRRMIGEDIELATLLTNDLGRIKADPGQVEQVILNLAVNARDAMPKGGKLTIETTNVELDENYARSHVGVFPGRYVKLSVSDAGIGMPPEIRAKIFEPFFTTKESGKGTGLGLSTVYGIVKQSGGNIWVYSEPGQGTTFKIYLPVIEEGATDSFSATFVSSQPFQGSETVLLVEDEKAVRMLASTILRKSGYKVLEAANGEEALRIVHGQPPRSIQLMLTDVVMPGLSGRQLAGRVASLQPTTKILYMSGYTDNAIVHHGVLDPGTAYIEKPFTPETLASKVREVLDSP
jgi:PAS domain S-box-containing protein